MRALGDLKQAAVRPAPTVLGDRLGEDVAGRIGRGMNNFPARVLVLTLTRERDREDFTMGAFT